MSTTNGNGSGHKKIVNALLASNKCFFTASDFAEVTGVNLNRDANRIIAELESKGILELYKGHDSTYASLMWQLNREAATRFVEQKPEPRPEPLQEVATK